MHLAQKLPPFAMPASPLEPAMVSTAYDRTLLPDYTSQNFDDGGRMLIQQPIYDEQKRLIRPWEQYELLRPGTIVLVTAELQAHITRSLITWLFEMKYMQVLVPAGALQEQYVQDFPSSETPS
ncbi:hypothetical protein EYR40_000444 [Pleurotus pulmonarius]|nr:hypothetical protein EYR36_004184 [Pleurotus pulmonarius]KAF4579390.1 hypothetical protein EYR36_001200 [Pleurotus pulmonarius]KAF4608100.1 hypothetical protein EYR40_000444 [Pleurotus pulmonarius]